MKPFWHPKRILRRDAHPTRIKSSVATFNALPSFVHPMRMKPQKGLAASASYNSVTCPTCTKAISLPRGQRVPLGPTQKKAAQVSLCCRPSLQSKEPFERASRNDSVDVKKCFVVAGFTFLQNPRFLQSFWSHLVEHCLRASILYQAGSQQPFRLTTCHLRKTVASRHQSTKLEAIGAGNWSKNWLCSMSDRNYNDDVSMTVNIQAKDSHP